MPGRVAVFGVGSVDNCRPELEPGDTKQGRGRIHWSWSAVTRQRVTKEEKAQRQQWAVAQIDKGVGFSELTSLTAETWGVSRRQARTVVTEAHKEWLDAFNDQDIH